MKPAAIDMAHLARIRELQLRESLLRMEARALRAEAQLSINRAEQVGDALKREAQGLFVAFGLDPADTIDLDTGRVTVAVPAAQDPTEHVPADGTAPPEPQD